MSVYQASDGDLVGGLSRWLSERLDAPVEVTGAVEPAQGLSSRTLLFTARWEDGEGAHDRDLVARVQRDTACPLLADVFHQYRVMQTAGAQDARVPRLPFAEHDRGVLGQPFFIMDRVDGRVPPDFPSFHAQGWVTALDPAERTRLWWNGVAAMRELHAADWRHFGFLGAEDTTPPDARFYIDRFLRPWLDWAADGRCFSALEDALARVAATAPPVRSAGLAWNDARMGNVLFAADLSVGALLDFEVATLGPPEIDLAWWLYAEDVFSTNFGVPRLAGIPEGEEAIAGFERLYGRAMPDFDYYLAIAALKHAILGVRNYGNGKVVEADAALPGFAIEHLHRALDRHAKRRGR